MHYLHNKLYIQFYIFLYREHLKLYLKSFLLGPLYFFETLYFLIFMIIIFFINFLYRDVYKFSK